MTHFLGNLFFWFFVFIVLLQLFYYLFFFVRLAFYKEKEVLESQEYPVSVVVCARDEAGNLVKSLPGILLQKYQTTHEVVLVNDNSVDDTKYLLEEFQKTFKQLRVLPLTQEGKLIPGKKFPLSMGIRTAKYDVLLLSDADCMPASEYWIQKMQEGYKKGIDIVLGYGAYQKKKGFLNKLIRFETFHTALQYLSYALAGIPYMGVGRNLSYKRNIFMESKGFASINHIPGGDDDLFINKIATKTNTAIVIHKDAHTISEPKTTWTEWRKQKNRHYTTAKYYKPKFKFLLGLYSAGCFLVYPLALLSIIFYGWKAVLVLLVVRWLLLAFVWKKSMEKLNESDLWSYFLLFDFWNCLYYLLFLPSVFKKPAKSWK
ncbi:MAG: glycosyl transferase family 2 [Pseudopedobacter saltans]|uniref:Glycosyl transferase family 2 n=1 Tax=Pseudopedobacter saltans TaxID=151895 RepID=A0A2W5F7Z2_9SPHI|nr:MAG: glycosyl transferase family 2 [Pseudopedobacter saltans]